MANSGFKGGLVSNVKNLETGKKYTISTAQELGKDYWSSTIFKKFFFGLFPNLANPVLSFIRNNKEDAHQIHHKLEQIVENLPESDWFRAASPLPEEGLSKDAEDTLKRLL